ncbi:hypothetical protein D3C84_957250 [compost metagenome]
MAFLLFFQAFLEFFDQLVEAAEGLDRRPLFVGQRALEFLAQPVLRDQRLQVIVEFFQAIEVSTEGAVELVEMLFVLDQNRPGQVVKLIHVGEGHALFQRVDQVQQLSHRDRYLGCAHFIEEVEQHGLTPV